MPFTSGGDRKRSDRGWHEMRCPCGATWRWYGAEGEGDFLKRLWARHHQPHGMKPPI
jgi:hypothetical protein